MEMFQRTLAQLQHPQGMIPNLPLHMPAWGALSQMPAVFPVYVPIPALMTLFGERREPGSEGEGDKARNPWLGIPTAQEWRTMLERWVVTARNNEEAPPAYTPRDTEEHEKKAAKVAEHAQPSASTSAAARRVGYESVPVPEQEVKSYGYRPAKKQLRKTQKKHDRMLILFWIPILFSEYLVPLVVNYDSDNHLCSWFDLGFLALDASRVPCRKGCTYHQSGASCLNI